MGTISEVLLKNRYVTMSSGKNGVPTKGVNSGARFCQKSIICSKFFYNFSSTIFQIVLVLFVSWFWKKGEVLADVVISLVSFKSVSLYGIHNNCSTEARREWCGLQWVICCKFLYNLVLIRSFLCCVSLLRTPLRCRKSWCFIARF